MQGTAFASICHKSSRRAVFPLSEADSMKEGFWSHSHYLLLALWSQETCAEGSFPPASLPYPACSQASVKKKKKKKRKKECNQWGSKDKAGRVGRGKILCNAQNSSQDPIINLRVSLLPLFSKPKLGLYFKTPSRHLMRRLALLREALRHLSLQSSVRTQRLKKTNMVSTLDCLHFPLELNSLTTHYRRI